MTGRLLPGILLSTALFPYVSMFKTPFDTQPYTLLAAIALVAVTLTRDRLMRTPDALVWLGGVAAIASLEAITLGLTTGGIRSMVGYWSTVMIAMAVMLRPIVSTKILVIGSAIWLAVGSAQHFFGRQIGIGLVSRMSTSPTRGVTSLAVEPSFYAVVCLFLLVLADYARDIDGMSKRRYVALVVVIIPQFFLAASGLGMVLLAVYLLCRAAFVAKPAKAAVSLALLGLGFLIVNWAYSTLPSLEGTRLAQLLDTGSSSVTSLAYVDESISQRLFDVVVTHLSLFDSMGLGYGVGNWPEGVREIVGTSTEIARLSTLSLTSARVGSGFGSAVYELGVVGLVIPLALWWAVIRALRRVGNHRWRWFICAGVALTVTMESAVPLAFPLFGYVLGLIMSHSVIALHQVGENPRRSLLGGAV